MFPVSSPPRISRTSVTFEPGARSAWHSHPPSQMVAAGTGWALHESGEWQKIRPAAVIWTPGAKPWHGTTATSSVTHIATQESLEGFASRVDAEDHR